MSLLAALGLAVLFYRVGVWPRLRPIDALASRLDDVSIVIPARDEAEALPSLLESLQGFIALGCEVVVVDDHSTDATRAVAEAFGARVIAAPDRPEGWSGKNWACWTGAHSTSRAFILFTDADTRHCAGSVGAARALMGDADVLSCVPYHRIETPWEACLGLFHLLLLVATAALQAPRAGRLFAVGQYLMVRREFYCNIDGHAAVRGALAEDLALARRTLERGGRYRLVTQQRLFEVRMYPDFGAFVRGWRRNLRLGMRASVIPVLEIAAVMAALFAGVSGRAADGAISLAALAVVLWRQRRLGAFPWWGALGAPFALGVFTGVSWLAVFDRALGRDVRWKGRRYAGRVE